jgi:hypothetical protein
MGDDSPQSLNYWAEYKEIQQITVNSLELICSSTGGNGDNSTQVPRNLATPLLMA